MHVSILVSASHTAHFNVLMELGFDSRRVIIYETAPLYHVTADRNYPPMQIIVAEHDMSNRFEQTQLLISTLKHMGCPQDKIDYRFMPGYKHCEYRKYCDDNGDSIMGKVFYEFISKH